MWKPLQWHLICYDYLAEYEKISPKELLLAFSYMELIL